MTLSLGLNARFIDALWRNLRHPPISYLGDEFSYRTADGSNKVGLPVWEVMSLET